MSVGKFLKERVKPGAEDEYQWEYAGSRSGFWLYDDDANRSMVRAYRM